MAPIRSPDDRSAASAAATPIPIPSGPGDDARRRVPIEPRSPFHQGLGDHMAPIRSPDDRSAASAAATPIPIPPGLGDDAGLRDPPTPGPRCRRLAAGGMVHGGGCGRTRCDAGAQFDPLQRDRAPDHRGRRCRCLRRAGSGPARTGFRSARHLHQHPDPDPEWTAIGHHPLDRRAGAPPQRGAEGAAASDRRAQHPGPHLDGGGGAGGGRHPG